MEKESIFLQNTKATLGMQVLHYTMKINDCKKFARQKLEATRTSTHVIIWLKLAFNKFPRMDDRTLSSAKIMGSESNIDICK